jgi:thioredoxin-related protein
MGSWAVREIDIVITRRFFLIALLVSVIPLPLNASAPRDPYQYFFEQSLGDLSEELEIAREDGKQGIFVFFELDECPFCHRMKQTVLNQPEVQEFFRSRFHSLAVDIEGDIEIIDFDGNPTTQKEFARAHRVRATPLLVFYDLQGEQVFKYVGAPSGVEEFLWMGEYVAEQVYLLTDDRGMNIRFTRYKQMRRLNKTL